MTPLRQIWHLVTRFFGVITSEPLGPVAQDDVNGILGSETAALFWDQDSIDQRHAYDVAQRVRDGLGDNEAALEAALLHDVGKRHSDLGPIARSLATLFDHARLPLPAGWQRYRDHGSLGATDLERAGAGSLAVAFARGEATAGIDPEVWAVLMAADDA